MNTLLQFMRFVTAGSIGFLVIVGTTYVLTEYVHLWYLLAYIIATPTGWASIFLVNSLFTFAGHTKNRYGTKFISFIGIYLVAFGINTLLVYALTSLVGFHYLFSIAVATVVTTSINFYVSKKYIFTYSA